MLKVNQLAQEKQITIAKLAREAKLDVRMVRRYWYNEVESVSLPALQAIADVLKVDVTELLDMKQTAA